VYAWAYGKAIKALYFAFAHRCVFKTHLSFTTP